LSKTASILIGLLFLVYGISAEVEKALIEITGAWVREVLPGQTISAAYLTLENLSDQADAVTGISCDCAKTVEMHRMIHTAGKMKMEMVHRLELPAKGKLELKPGGFHLMLFGVKSGLKEGDKVNLTFEFEHSKKMTIEATVKAAEGKKHEHSN
jgi:copper(I)-binding protein